MLAAGKTKDAVVSPAAAGTFAVYDRMLNLTNSQAAPGGMLSFLSVTDIPPVDTDGDGIPDSSDNCTLVANTGQQDTDADGYGNICDPDFDNNNIVNAADLAYMRTTFFSSDPLSDLNSDGVVNAGDLAILSSFFFMAPGPSGIVP
jgi:hypothetical protein